VPDLLRPEPPRSLLERLAAVRAVLHPARAATALGLALLLVVAGWWLFRPSPAPVEDTLPRATTTSLALPSSTIPAGLATRSTTTAGATVLVVQIAGAVVRPGVYHVPAGARVIDLVNAAGGPVDAADLQAMSLAAHLVDGERVQVPHKGERLPASATGGAVLPGPDVAPGGPASSVPPAPLDLNTATVGQLDALPGVGPAIAQAIVAYRDKHGAFASVEDLADVPGIGPAKLDALRDLVRV
jgi:competence protein ComEA